MAYKIRKALNKGPRNPFYINVAVFHLPRPSEKCEGFVDGHPIIFIDIEKAQ